MAEAEMVDSVRLTYGASSQVEKVNSDGVIPKSILIVERTMDGKPSVHGIVMLRWQ
jgi:hypothetical protein